VAVERIKEQKVMFTARLVYRKNVKMTGREESEKAVTGLIVAKDTPTVCAIGVGIR
jgi:hypothetical protein